MNSERSIKYQSYKTSDSTRFLDNKMIVSREQKANNTLEFVKYNSEKDSASVNQLDSSRLKQ